MPERGSHEALERLGIGRGAPRSGGPAAGRARSSHTRGGSSAPGHACAGAVRYHSSPAIPPRRRADARAAARRGRRQRRTAGRAREAAAAAQAGSAVASRRAPARLGRRRGVGSPAAPSLMARAAAGRPASRSRGLELARPSSVSGHIGLKLYHCSGAARRSPRGSRRSAGSRAGCPRVRGRDGERLVALDPERAVRRAPDGERRDDRAGLRREGRGPGRQRRPGPEQAHRDAVGPVAPVDEQGEDLLRRSTLNSSRRLRHGMTWTPHDSRCSRSSSNSSGNDESSATTLAG